MHKQKQTNFFFFFLDVSCCRPEKHSGYNRAAFTSKETVCKYRLAAAQNSQSNGQWGRGNFGLRILSTLEFLKVWTKFRIWTALQISPDHMSHIRLRVYFLVLAALLV